MLIMNNLLKNEKVKQEYWRSFSPPTYSFAGKRWKRSAITAIFVMVVSGSSFWSLAKRKNIAWQRFWTLLVCVLVTSKKCLSGSQTYKLFAWQAKFQMLIKQCLMVCVSTGNCMSLREIIFWLSSNRTPLQFNGSPISFDLYRIQWES